ncbi:MAG: hypothetical protein DWQ58_21305 [Microcystis aeruginosa TA09]|nr:MAG: hypothetical protein DWQ58_21305 [Microcystis aeruginosa TA09]
MDYLRYSVFQSAEVQKLWVLGKRQEAKVKREEKYVYLTSLGNAIVKSDFFLLERGKIGG